MAIFSGKAVGPGLSLDGGNSTGIGSVELLCYGLALKRKE